MAHHECHCMGRACNIHMTLTWGSLDRALTLHHDIHATVHCKEKLTAKLKCYVYLWNAFWQVLAGHAWNYKHDVLYGPVLQMVNVANEQLEFAIEKYTSSDDIQRAVDAVQSEVSLFQWARDSHLCPGSNGWNRWTVRRYADHALYLCPGSNGWNRWTVRRYADLQSVKVFVWPRLQQWEGGGPLSSWTLHWPETLFDSCGLGMDSFQVQ